MKGIVSDILSFSLNDGPGIRTTVFLKGCPLRCQWCHNPENVRISPQALYASHQCVRCGACAAVCPHALRRADGSWKTDGRACTGCGKCAAICPTGASRLVGREMGAEDVARQVLRDRAFFRRRGGVTFSGGEPLFQADFTRECLDILKKAGVHTALETCLCVSSGLVKRLIPYVDLWLCDWKLTNADRHKAFTGQDNRRIKENLLLLNQAGADIILRCPIIPGVNDTEEHFAGILRLTAECPHICGVNILPYHHIGNDKRKKMGLPEDGFTVPDDRLQGLWLNRLREGCNIPVTL